MKKNGFTLAEVLITLAIIGVVATMTLPALMTNTQEQQAKTGLKKAINTLTEAAQMNQALENWAYDMAIEANNSAGITTDTELNAMNFDSLIGNRLSIDYSKGTALPSNLGSSALLSGYTAVYLKDGSAIYYKPNEAKATDDNRVQQDDGLALGYTILFDTNGVTGPNIISNCNGTAVGELEVKDSYANFVSPVAATTACAKKGDRVIKDIVPIRLRGTIAQPEGEAATWAYNGDVKAAGASQSQGGGSN